MRQIIKETGRQQMEKQQMEGQQMEGQQMEGHSTLLKDFNELSTHAQVDLLKKSHEDKINDLNKLSAQISEPKIIINEPETAGAELYGGKLNLFAPTTEEENKPDIKPINNIINPNIEEIGETNSELNSELNKDVKIIKL